jgi:hypothetical protein
VKIRGYGKMNVRLKLRAEELIRFRRDGCHPPSHRSMAAKAPAKALGWLMVGLALAEPPERPGLPGPPQGSRTPLTPGEVIWSARHADAERGIARVDLVRSARVSGWALRGLV